jgi:hypothetical protein
MNEAITLEEYRRRSEAGTLYKRPPSKPLPPVGPQHGTMTRYRKKCRCELCITASKEYYASPRQMAAKKKRNDFMRKKRAAETNASKKK